MFDKRKHNNVCVYITEKTRERISHHKTSMYMKTLRPTI